MRTRRFTTMSDSYKLNHWNQYPPGTRYVSSYLECRQGALFPATYFYGLQPILKSDFSGPVVTKSNIDWLCFLAKEHFGRDGTIVEDGWKHILKEHNGHPPLSIRAVPEGTKIPISNVEMQVINTDDKVPWLTNFVESRLTHVWYPSTACTISGHVIDLFAKYLDKTSDNAESLIKRFMLHDFGYRSGAGDDAAAWAGSGHLVHSFGTDNVPAIEWAAEFYPNDPDPLKSLIGLGYSVPATEHSVMTAMGPDGEEEIVGRLLNEYDTGILSLVADSFDPYYFIDHIIGNVFKDKIRARKPDRFGNNATVTRPDSTTDIHPKPADQVVWILETHWKNFDKGTVNNKKYRVLEPCIRALWGDGLSITDIVDICEAVVDAGFSVENLVYGMGGGLIQKHNRDTQRHAFKSSAQCRDGEWHDIFKKPRDPSKASKKGRLKLVKDESGNYLTVAHDDPRPDEMLEVYRDGKILVDWTFSDVRKHAGFI